MRAFSTFCYTMLQLCYKLVKAIANFSIVYYHKHCKPSESRSDTKYFIRRTSK